MAPPSEDDPRVQRLLKEHGYNPATAIAYVAAVGRCTYCGENLFDSPSGFWSAQIDHLLPDHAYPQFRLTPANCVYSCYRCNSAKHGFDPLQVLKPPGEHVDDPMSWLSDRREELIEAVRLHLKGIRDSDGEVFRQIIALVSES